MYYDVLLAALPVFLLFPEPRRHLQPVLVALVPAGGGGGAASAYYAPRPASAYPAPYLPVRARRPHVWVLNSFVLTVLALLAVVEYVFPWLGVEVTVRAGVRESALDSTTTGLRLATGVKGPPWHTLLLMALWAWCGVTWLWQVPAKAESKAPTDR
jgi:hypothetical protein